MAEGVGVSMWESVTSGGFRDWLNTNNDVVTESIHFEFIFNISIAIRIFPVEWRTKGNWSRKRY